MPEWTSCLSHPTQTLCAVPARLLGQELTCSPGHLQCLDTGTDTSLLACGHSCTQTLCAAPARLLGQELILDKAEQGCHGLSNEVDIAFCVGDAKVIYPVGATVCDGL